MTEILEYIAKSLVTHKDDVSIRVEETETTTVLHLTVHQEDMGQIIGKQGRVIQAIRSIIKTASRGMDKRYLVEIDE
ncbi:MAG: KH domain-containing protein [Clostridiales bacterium]|jgi:predicted RNA-binding protein YlqC (UPF0109 family)|nr:KH domain-containing protein [Clostridiales bacterium]